MRPRIFRIFLGVALALLVAPLVTPGGAHAQVKAYCDGSGALATADGTIEAGEYPDFTIGVGGGFGGIIGEGVEMHFDSDAAGNLALAIDGTDRNCTWTANDTVVVYIDSIPGAGFADTTGFTDTGDPGRAGISAANPGGGRADLTFAPDFGADYAIAISNDSANLFQLQSGAPHTFVATLTRGPVAGFATSCVKELAGLSMAQLGSQPGNPIRWMATVLNPNDNPPFRSNELQGVAVAPADNIGGTAFTLADGSRNTFATHGLAALGGPRVWIDFATFAGAGFTPTPTCGQLSSMSWAVTGMSDPGFEFGEIRTTGDFARGVGLTTATTGGIYAYDVATNDRALGVLPAGADFTPGTFTLRVRNDGAETIASLSIAYAIRVFNSQGRANSFNFSVSEDGTTFTPFTGLDYTSPEAADMPPSWLTIPRTAVLTGIDLAPGAYVYLRWTGDDVSGAGSRDRFALDDIVLVPVPSSCGNGTLDPGEACDAGAENGTTPCGCTGSCSFAATGTACGGGDGGACDAPDTCDGAGACVERFATGTICRPSEAPCDAAETCDGSGVDCPADGVATAGTVCGAADPSLPCDAPDVCDGVSLECQPRVAAAGTTCRESTGACDLGASCDGGSTACPASAPATGGTPCRAAIGVCDVAETCTGSSLECPMDLTAPDGTACGDGAACNGAEVCGGGVCMGTPVDCDDGDLCTADVCEEPAGTCASTPIAGCCLDDEECDDGDPCTMDACSGANTCEYVDICADGGVDADGGVQPDAGMMMPDGGTIAPDAGLRRDGAIGDASDLPDGGDAPVAAGCSCRVPGGSAPTGGRGALLLALLGLALVWRRRR